MLSHLTCVTGWACVGYLFDARPPRRGQRRLAWLNPLLKLGATRALEHDDLGKLAERDRAEVQFQRFDHAWFVVAPRARPRASHAQRAATPGDRSPGRRPT